MARTTREKYFMIAVGAAAGLWALDRYALSPYLDARAEVAASQLAADQKLLEVEQLQVQDKRMRRTWARMRQAGVESAPSEAERKMLHAIQSWAQEAGIAHVSLRPERINKEHGFVQVVVHATGSGPTAAVAKLLWSVESAGAPAMRVDDVQLRPAKEGADELLVELTASTLCATPQAEEKKRDVGRQPVAAGGGGGARVREERR